MNSAVAGFLLLAFAGVALLVAGFYVIYGLGAAFIFSGLAALIGSALLRRGITA